MAESVKALIRPVRTWGSSTSSLPLSSTSLTLWASMKVRNEKKLSVESTPIGWAKPEKPLAGLGAGGGLHLLAPERPVVRPRGGDVGRLDPGLVEHVVPVLDMNRLLLERERVVRLLFRLVAVEVRGLYRVGRKALLDRHQHAADVLELAVVGPLAGDLEVERVGVGHIGRIA